MKNIPLYALIIILKKINPAFTESKYQYMLHAKFKKNASRFNYSESDLILFKIGQTNTTKELLNWKNWIIIISEKRFLNVKNV